MLECAPFRLTMTFMLPQFIYHLAAPKHFYYRAHSYLFALGLAAFLFIGVGMLWGLFGVPADYQQGDAFRIIYIHVPAAFLSLSLYAGMAFLAALLLIWRIKLAGLLLVNVAQLGATMALIALVTGSIWGKPMWGTWWIWDARLTSELILLLLYLAILATEYAFSNPEQGEKVIAILTLVGLIDLPIIHYSVVWWNTLHQGATLSLFAKPKIASVMLYPLLCTLVGFALFALWVILHKACNTILLRERRQRWVAELMQKEKS